VNAPMNVLTGLKFPVHGPGDHSQKTSWWPTDFAIFSEFVFLSVLAVCGYPNN
jgi:hypothetical protein